MEISFCPLLYNILDFHSWPSMPKIFIVRLLVRKVCLLLTYSSVIYFLSSKTFKKCLLGVEDRIETHQSEGAVTGEEEEEVNRGPPAFLPCPLSHSLRGASQKPGFRTTVHVQEYCPVLFCRKCWGGRREESSGYWGPCILSRAGPALLMGHYLISSSCSPTGW